MNSASIGFEADRFGGQSKNLSHVNRTRIELIRDALVGTAYHLARPDLFLYPFVDLLLMLFQRPVVISIWRDGDLFFSSFADAYHRTRYEIKFPSDPQLRIQLLKSPDYVVTVHKLSDDHASFDANLCSELNFLLRMNRWPGGNASDFYKVLQESLNSYGDDPPIARVGAVTSRLPASTICYAEMLEMVDPMRTALDEALSDAIESPFLRTARSGNQGQSANVPDVFAALRTVPCSDLRYNGSFNFTAGLLLSKSQREGIRKRLNLAESDSSLDEMEQCLGLNSRSCADGLFCSGVVDFSSKAGRPGWDVAGDAPDKRRVEVEKLVYRQLWRSEQASLFYVPIHVGGTPWLALFTHSSEDPHEDEASWRHNYRFYRDVIPTLAHRIRTSAKEAYLQKLTKKFTESLKPWNIEKHAVAQNISRTWARLAQAYPFPLVELSPHEDMPPPAMKSSTGSFVLPVLGRGAFTAAIRDNPFFHKQVAYGIVLPLEVRQALEAASRSLSGTIETIEVGGVALGGHLFKTPLRTLASLAKDITDPRKGEILEIAEDLDALEKFAGALIRANDTSTLDSLPDDLRGDQSTVEEFRSFVEVTLRQAIAARSNPRFSATGANAMRILNDTKKLETHLHLEIKGCRCVRYCREQVKVTIHALLDNSFGNPPNTEADLSVSVSLRSDAQCEKLFFEMSNTTCLKGHALKDAIERIKLGGVGYVGCTTVLLGCKVCGYTLPDWTIADGPSFGTVKATVQIGAIATNEL
jgi:hypothetical protein